MFLKPALKIALLPLALVGGNAIATQSTSTPGPKALELLVATLKDRLEIADLVALTKWDSAMPIQDGDRESQVIASAQQTAAKFGINKDDIKELLAAQIEANKLVQYGLHAAWFTAGEAPDTLRPDLKGQIRPQLDDLQARLLEQYVRFSPYRTHPDCSVWLKQARTNLASDALHDVALVRATGELCIRNKP
ncbi:chorismate mutase [Pseudomonas silesiensis]